MNGTAASRTRGGTREGPKERPADRSHHFISALPSPVVPSPEGTAEGGVTVIRREKSGYEGETSQVATGTEEDWDR